MPRKQIHLRHSNDPSFDIMDGLMRVIDPIFKVMHDKGRHGCSEKIDGCVQFLEELELSFYSIGFAWLNICGK